MSLAADLAIALSMADAADAITLGRFGAPDLAVSTKPDDSPVTDADLAVEELIRDRLSFNRPGDGFLGEESGSTLPDAPRRWIVDPIDGTKNYARGVPVWATLIGLEAQGQVVLGVASAPALGRRWWATLGAGAWSTGPGSPRPRRLQVSGVRTLAAASLSFSGIGGWAEHGRLEAFMTLAQTVGRTRGYGDFWSHLLVAEGAVDLAAEPEVTQWDLAALDIIVREAGGSFTDLAGRPGPAGGSALASNGHLHAAALELLTPPTPPTPPTRRRC